MCLTRVAVAFGPLAVMLTAMLYAYAMSAMVLATNHNRESSVVGKC